MAVNGVIILELSVICYHSEAAKAEVESKQKGYATHEEAKQAFKDLLREKVLIYHHYSLVYVLLSF